MSRWMSAEPNRQPLRVFARPTRPRNCGTSIRVSGPPAPTKTTSPPLSVIRIACVDGGLGADRLDGDVRAASVGQVAHRGHQVRIACGHDVGGAHRAGDLQLRRDQVDRDDPPRPTQAGALDRAQPHAAAAEHDDAVAPPDRGGSPRCPHAGEDRATQQGRGRGGDVVGDRDHRDGRHHHPLREGARRDHLRDRHPVGGAQPQGSVQLRTAEQHAVAAFAQAGLAARASVAPAALRHRADRDVIADRTVASPRRRPLPPRRRPRVRARSAADRAAPRSARTGPRRRSRRQSSGPGPRRRGVPPGGGRPPRAACPGWCRRRRESSFSPRSARFLILNV